MQAVQDTDNTLFQGCSANNAIIYYNQIINEWFDTSVSYIVHMGGQVVTAVAFGDKGTQLYVFNRYFFGTDTHGKYLVEFFFLK